MANALIYTGNSNWVAGTTPFGYYDNDTDFIADAPKVAKFCAQKLGYPLVDVELQDTNFFQCFEEAVTVYGNEVYLAKTKDNYLNLEGSTTGSPLNNTVVTPNLSNLLSISEMYGQAVQVGGNVEVKKALIQLNSYQQDYDLTDPSIYHGSGSGLDNPSASLAAGDKISITRVFWQQTPGIVRFFDPYLGSGFNYQGMMESFGWGSLSPAVSYMMFPLFWDIERVQAIEMSDMVRRSNFSFELKGNKLSVFPIPGPAANAGYMALEYSLQSDLSNPNNNAYSGSKDLVTNISNVPYNNPVYKQINYQGRMWIMQYTAALAKEMLGLIRGKYTTVPIPGAETTLNHAELLSQASAEKIALLEKLRGDLDAVSRKAQLENKQAEAQSLKSTLNEIPLQIYIG